MDYDIGSSIVYFGVGVSTFLAITLIRKKEKRTHNWLLIIWFSVVAAHLIFYQYTPYLEAQNLFILIGLGAALPVLHIIIIYMYCYALKEDLSLKRIAPNLAVYLLYTGVFSYHSASNDLEIIELSLFFRPDAPVWCIWLAPSFLILYVIYSIQIFYLIKGVRFNLRQFYSSNEMTKVQWLYLWVLSYLLVSAFIVISILASDLNFVSRTFSFISVVLAMSLQVFLVGQVGIISRFSFPETLLVEQMESKYKSSGLKSDVIESLKLKLIGIIENEKLYLNQDLTLKDLADGLQIPAYQVSQLINEGFNKTFFDLINGYRIEEFKQRLNDKNYSHLTLLGIAFDCGFNSKSGFYKTFKSFTDISPSQYKKDQSAK